MGKSDNNGIVIHPALLNAIDIIVTGGNIQNKVEWVLQNYLRYRQKMAAIDTGIIKDALDDYNEAINAD